MRSPRQPGDAQLKTRIADYDKRITDAMRNSEAAANLKQLAEAEGRLNLLMTRRRQAGRHLLTAAERHTKRRAVEHETADGPKNRP